MKEYLFQKILRLEEIMAVSSAQKSNMSTRRKRNIIPEEYFIEVITVIPDKRNVLNIYEV